MNISKREWRSTVISCEYIHTHPARVYRRLACGMPDRLSLPLKDCLKGVGVGIEFIARVSGILIERAMLELPIQLSRPTRGFDSKQKERIP